MKSQQEASSVRFYLGLGAYSRLMFLHFCAAAKSKVSNVARNYIHRAYLAPLGPQLYTYFYQALQPCQALDLLS